MGSIRLNNLNNLNNSNNMIHKAQPECFLLSESSKMVIQRGRTKDIAKLFQEGNLSEKESAKAADRRNLGNVFKLTKFFETEAKKQLPIPIIRKNQTEIPHRIKERDIRREGIQLEKPIEEIQKKEFEKEVEESIIILLRIIDKALVYDDADLKETVSNEMKEIVNQYRENVFKNPEKETYKLFQKLYAYSTSKIKETADFSKMIHECANKEQIPVDEFFKRNGKMEFNEFKSLYPEYPIRFKEQFELVRDFTQNTCGMVRLYKSLKALGINLENYK